MKRSEINKIIRQEEIFLKDKNYFLPEWAGWGLSDWEAHRDQVKQIVQCNMGWDITDFGSSDFKQKGLFLFTLRNGISGSEKNVKPYAEKILIVGEEQETPQHNHKYKKEDIINRCGGVLVVEVWNTVKNLENICFESMVSICIDGIERTIPAGGVVKLNPGQSVTLENHHIHRFYAEKGKGKVLAGEVSMVNDDDDDNYFIDSKVGRFSEIEEDCEPYHLLVSDYDKYLT